MGFDIFDESISCSIFSSHVSGTKGDFQQSDFIPHKKEQSPLAKYSAYVNAHTRAPVKYLLTEW